MDILLKQPSNNIIMDILLKQPSIVPSKIMTKIIYDINKFIGSGLLNLKEMLNYGNAKAAMNVDFVLCDGEHNQRCCRNDRYDNILFGMNRVISRTSEHWEQTICILFNST